MDAFFLTTAGIFGMLIALGHGYLGQSLILRPITGMRSTLKRVNDGVFHLSTLYWFVGGAALVCAPIVLDGSGQSVVAWIMVFIYASGAAVNFWATRGRHFGWMLLAGTTVLVLLGA